MFEGLKDFFSGGLLFGSDPEKQLRNYLPPAMVDHIPAEQRQGYVDALKRQVGMSMMGNGNPAVAISNFEKNFYDAQKIGREMRMQDSIDKILNGGPQPPAAGGVAQPDPNTGAVPPAPNLTPLNANTALPEIRVTGAQPQSAGKAKAALYRQIGDKLAPFDATKANSYYAIADKLDPKVTYTNPIEVIGPDGRPVLVQPDSEGNLTPVADYKPKQALPDYLDAFRYLYKREPDYNDPNDRAAIEHLAKISRPGTTVNVGEQQDFKNERDLRTEFTGLPITKAFTEVQTAFDQIKTALSRPSAANDLVAATKFMKLLDPNSVVRESELGMAMAATGMLDRVQNYFEKLKAGTVLTPSQRADFLQSATALYNAAYGRYAPVVEQYRSMASQYKLNPDRVVRIPSSPGALPANPAQNDPLGIRR